MTISHIPGYYTASDAAVLRRVKPKTIRDRIKRGEMSWAKVDGLKLVHLPTSEKGQWPVGVSVGMLEWVNRCAERNNISSERIYEQIIHGNIPAVTLAGRVFVIKKDPSLLQFFKTAKRRKTPKY